MPQTAEMDLVEFVTRYDAPAIQFDDHFSLKKTFGYDNFTLALYEQGTGRTGRPSPDDADWLRWRATKLTQFVAQVSRAIKAARLAIGVMAGQKPATVPVGMVHDQTAMAREHGFGVVYFVQESLLRFTTPSETVESRFEALRLLAPEASTRR